MTDGSYMLQRKRQQELTSFADVPQPNEKKKSYM